MSGASPSTNLAAVVSCNFPSHRPSNPRTTRLLLPASLLSARPSPLLHLRLPPSPVPRGHGRLPLFLRRCSSDTGPEDRVAQEVQPKDADVKDGGRGRRNWATSVLLFGLYAAVMYYVTQLSPNQTPSRDMYFVQKLLNIKGDDGFQMNEVLVALWYIMGLWPLVYSMLLLPSGRSSGSKIVLWPFLVVSFFFGVYSLIPYFILWSPPPPPVNEEEIGKWPLSFLESKITAGVVFALGLGLIIYASLASGEVWTEFYQYFRESRLIHATSLDFSLLSAFSAFWVYNDMTGRRWYAKGSWLLPVALIPFLGPAFYLLLRPSLSELPSVPSSKVESK